MAIAGTKQAEQPIGCAVAPASSCREAYMPATVLLKQFICQQMVSFLKPSIIFWAIFMMDAGQNSSKTP